MNPANSNCQRWRDRQHSWRHVSEGGFNKLRYEVALIPDDTTAKQFVIQHHYSGSYGGAIHRAGLYHDGSLVGVAMFGTPAHPLVLPNAFPDLVPYQESVELCRFVLVDEVPANAESWFLGQAHRLIAAEGVRGVVSHADPNPRYGPDGEVVFPGHIGTIYQATNAMFTEGGTKPRPEWMFPDGTVFSERTKSKVLAWDNKDGKGRGYRYAVNQLIGRGATPPRGWADERFDEPVKAWLETALAQHTQRRNNPGKFRYLFALGTKAERSRVVFGFPSAPYPKKELIAA